MKISYYIRQILIFLNQALLLLFLSYAYLAQYIDISSTFHLTLISLMFFDAAYISYKNVKCNETLNAFTRLLMLSAWGFLFSIIEKSPIIFKIFPFLIIIIFYEIVRFALSFLFQASAYLYERQTSIILQGACILTIIGKMISGRIFSILFMLQILLSLVCLIFLICVHWKRVRFVLISQKKQFMQSFFMVIIPFIIYCFAFKNNPNYLKCMGSFFIIMLPCVSIYNIILYSQTANINYFILRKINKVKLIIACIIILAFIGNLFKFTVITYTVLVHGIVLLILFYYLLVYKQIEKMQVTTNKDDFESKHFYTYSLSQIIREEELKKEISNFLHDEVLQDLLSVKNMMKKANRPEVNKLIISTLDNLNISIREQMQEYHPVLLKDLTMKENVENLLNMVKDSFPISKIKVYLHCDDKIFLVEPYNLILYRIIKELVTNAFKHSNGTEINTTLVQKNEIIKLIVEDNGKGIKEKIITTNGTHKGIISIYEQVQLLDGKMNITDNDLSGTHITIFIPMKGDSSYESFIDR